MKSTIQKKLAGKLSKRSPKKVSLDNTRLTEIKEAITRADVRGLLKNGAIKVRQDTGISRSRAKANRLQKLKGRQRGQGSRKGKANARSEEKRNWINRVRLFRTFLNELKEKDKLEPEVYKDLYRKTKGGFFRSIRHMKLYLTEHKCVK
jgi:large subunit ribosomal protein L19e